MQPSTQRRVMRPADDTAERTTVACAIISANGNSLVISIANGRYVSLPLKQVKVNTNGSVSMPEWLARDRGLL